MKIIFTILLTATLLYSSDQTSKLNFLGKELKRDLSVLCISQEPGQEDFATIAYFRYQLGATITSAYVTNGEGTYHLREDKLPADVAPVRREEAANIIKLVKGEHFFMNMIYTVPNSIKELQQDWKKVELEKNIKELLLASQPDIIILFKEKNYLQNNYRSKLFTTTLSAFLKKSAVQKEFGKITILKEGGTGNEININQFSEELHESYQTYGQFIKMFYRSLSQNIKAADSISKNSFYSVVGSSTKVKWESIISPELQETKNLVTEIGTLLQNKTINKLPLLENIAIAISVIDSKLRNKKIRNDKKSVSVLFNWKKKLENTRVNLLGVKIHYTLSEKTIAPVQLTYLDIDSVVFPKELKGKTEIYFPLTSQGWIINEELTSLMPFESGTRYRIISPRDLTSFLPPHRYYTYRRTITLPFKYFVIHYDDNPFYNFMLEDNLEFIPADRFIVEPRWPIIKLQKNEKIPMYLANNSRDPVHDKLNVNDSLATGPEINFRLMTKGDIQEDTLVIEKVRPAQDGNYLLNIAIQGDVVSRVAARKFDVKTDSTKSIFIRSQSKIEPIIKIALNRIGLNTTASSTITGDISSDIIIIDRNDLFKKAFKEEEIKILFTFLQNGGKVVVLSQESVSWNTQSLSNELNIICDPKNVEQDIMSVGKMLLSPNNIETKLFENWLYQKVDNRIVYSGEIDLLEGDKNNLGIIGKQLGKGYLMYVNLNIHHQLMNIDPATYKLLGNIISY